MCLMPSWFTAPVSSSLWPLEAMSARLWWVFHSLMSFCHLLSISDSSASLTYWRVFHSWVSLTYQSVVHSFIMLLLISDLFTCWWFSAALCVSLKEGAMTAFFLLVVLIAALSVWWCFRKRVQHFTAKQVSVSYQRVVIRCSFFGGADRTYVVFIFFINLSYDDHFSGCMTFLYITGLLCVNIT